MYQSKKRMGWLFSLSGLCGECVSGMLLFQRAGLWLLALHILAVFLWALGINLLYHQGALPHRSPASWSAFVNKWGAGALLLGLFTFPGSGMLAYSAALVGAIFLRRRMGTVWERDVSEHRGVLEATVQPGVDLLQDTDLEAKRLAVATLRRRGTPEAMQMLRQLLLDQHADVRTDASIALTYLEERLSRSLNESFRQWKEKSSERERILNLADHYSQYAESNVLDKASQQFYLAKAYDLFQRVTTQGGMGSDHWLKLARVCQRLGKLEEALRAVRVVLRLDAQMSDAYSLAMELAFRLRNWDSLVAFARTGVDALPATSESSEAFQWWASLQAQ
jgi:tetratricopeptide (TPR) repeat protein